MSEMVKLLLMGLGCSSLLGLGSCMLFTGSLVYVGSRAADEARDISGDRPQRSRDPWESGRSRWGGSEKGVPRSFDGGDNIGTADRYGTPNVVLRDRD